MALSSWFYTLAPLPRVFIASLAGLVGYFLAFPPIGLWPLAWVGFVPLLYYACDESIPLRSYLWGASAALFVFFSILFYWITNFLAPGFPFVVLGFTFYFSLGCALIAWLGRRIPRWQLWIMTAGLFLAEMARTLGEVSLTWCLPAHSQATCPLMIQSACLWGPWGLSFLIIFVNAACARHWQARNRKGGRRMSRVGWVALAVPGFLILFGFVRLLHPPRPQSQAPRVALLQTGVNPERHTRNYGEDTFRLVEEAVAAQADLVVFPETVFYFNLYGYLREYRRLRGRTAYTNREPPRQDSSFLNISAWSFSLARNHGRHFLLTLPLSIEGKLFNSAILLEPNLPPGQWRQRYDKMKLVPFGEFLPYPALFGWAEPILKQARVSRFSQGKRHTVFRCAGVPFSVLICYEDLFTPLAAAMCRAGARCLINVTSDARFASAVASSQHLAGSCLTAVACGTYVYRAANTGYTCVVDPAGRIVNQIPLNVRQMLLVPLRAMPGPATAYVRAGHVAGPLLAWTSLGLLLAAFLVSLVQARGQRGDPA